MKPGKTLFLMIILPFLGLPLRAEAKDCSLYLKLEKAQDFKQQSPYSSVIKQFAIQNISFPQMINFIVMGTTVQQMLNRYIDTYVVLPGELEYLTKIMNASHAKFGIKVKIEEYSVYILTLQVFQSVPRNMVTVIKNFLISKYSKKILIDDNSILETFYKDKHFESDREELDKVLNRIVELTKGKRIQEISKMYKDSIAEGIKNKTLNKANTVVLIAKIKTDVQSVLIEELERSFPYLKLKNDSGKSFAFHIIKDLSSN